MTILVLFFFLNLVSVRNGLVISNGGGCCHLLML